MLGWMARKAVSDEARNWERNRGQTDVLGSFVDMVAEGEGIGGKIENFVTGVVFLMLFGLIMVGAFALAGFLLLWVLPRVLG
jgi:hypothetical protein